MIHNASSCMTEDCGSYSGNLSRVLKMKSKLAITEKKNMLSDLHSLNIHHQMVVIYYDSCCISYSHIAYPHMADREYKICVPGWACPFRLDPPQVG